MVAVWRGTSIRSENQPFYGPIGRLSVIRRLKGVGRPVVSLLIRKELDNESAN